MDKIKISVIIPVYNAEHTIERCISSIVSRHVPFEIICVDDGSKDTSWVVLQKIATLKSNIVLIHQENAGAGKARENGIAYAKGEYIMFCDSDDAYLPNTIDNIAEDVDKYNPDYIVFHRKALYQSGKEVLWGEGNDVSLLKTDWKGYLNNYMLQRSHGMGVVTKVFKKKLLDEHNVKFGEFLFGEDMWFNLTYLMHCSTFVEDYKTYYQQYVTDGSICQKSYHDFYDKNVLCIDTFISKYPLQALQVADFVHQFKFAIYTWSIQRVLLGIDAKGILQKYKTCKMLACRSDVRNLLEECMRSDILTEAQREGAVNLLNGHIIKYAWNNYYLNIIKSVVLNIIRRKK